jgi:hypothetical protein
MADETSGDIVIEGNAVRFSNSVGRYATNEQTAVLYRTAERLGKVAIADRYPTDPVLANGFEELYHDASPLDRGLGRNKHGVPNFLLASSLCRQIGGGR